MKKLLGLLLISLILTPLAQASATLPKRETVGDCFAQTWMGKFVCGPNQSYFNDPAGAATYQKCVSDYRQTCCNKFQPGTTYTADPIQGAICK